MAKVTVEKGNVHVALGGWERLGALHGDLRIPLANVLSATVSENPFKPVRGMRLPGTGLPGVIALGTWRSLVAGRSFAAAYRAVPALVLELRDYPFDRVVVSTPDAKVLSEAIAA